MSDYEGDPDHPILPFPFLWDLIEFIYHKVPNDWHESFIDMLFEREGETKRLRFFAPQTLEISEGLPNSFGMCILDVSSRQLDGIRVRVANFEQSYGAPTFWAAQVVEIVQQSPT